MKLTLLFSVFAVSALFCSCNTTIGVGRDMRILGEGLENSANKVRGTDSGDASGAPVY